MCYSIHKLTGVMRVCMAAQAVQQLIDDGTLAEAFGKNKANEAHQCVAAFNLLQETAAQLLDERKEVSPFIRYRKEILATGDIAGTLRNLVLNLWNGGACNLSYLFRNADPYHTRIALECVAAYTHHGENDRHFMDLAQLISERQMAEVTA